MNGKPPRPDPSWPEVVEQRAVDPHFHEFLGDLVVPSLLRQRQRDRVEGAALVHLKGVDAHRRLIACALLGVGRVGSLKVGAVQLALAAGPRTDRLAAWQVGMRRRSARLHRWRRLPRIDGTVLRSMSVGSATDRGSPTRLASRASS